MATELPETTDSSATQPSLDPTPTTSSSRQILIPVDIVSEEEMALIEAALAVTATRSSLSSSSSSYLSSSTTSSTQFLHNARSIGSITRLSKRRLSGCLERASIADIEDLSGGAGAGAGGSSSTRSTTQKKSKVTESPLHRFRRKKGLYVTDITTTEWCEKQKEFLLLDGKPKEKTKATQDGGARHAVLEKEVQ